MGMFNCTSKRATVCSRTSNRSFLCDVFDLHAMEKIAIIMHKSVV